MVGKRYSKYLKIIFLFCDLAMLNLSLFIGYLLVFKGLDALNSDTNILLFVLFNLMWILVTGFFQLYDLPRFFRSDNIIIKLAKTTFVTFLLVFAIAFTLKYYLVSRYMIYYSFWIFFSMAVMFRMLLIPLMHWYRKAGYFYRNLIIIGSGPLAREVMKVFTADLSVGLKVIGVFDDHPDREHLGHRVTGNIQDAMEFSKDHHVDEIVVALTDLQKETIDRLIRFCDNNMIRITIVPDFYRKLSYPFLIDFYGPIPFLSIRNEPLQSFRNRLLKRGFDLLFSTIIILLVFPWFLPLVAILIKLSSPGPVFFIQERSGLNNRVFRMIKFRTMRNNDEADQLQASRNDPRVTSIGKFLRKTNLDEMPQFFNVWMGQMSVVGPRPHMLMHTEVYSKIIDRFMVRQMVKPGLTGWAQVTGSRGETGKPELMAKRVQKDVWYIEHWSFFLDMQIIVVTLYKMITGDKQAF